ncbi:endonuclease/exonuclease/phosphatase family protein [Nocardioides marmoraquaticus]
MLTLLRWWGPDQHHAVLLASFASYAAPAYLLLAVVLGVAAVRARRRVLPAAGLVLALLGLGVHAAWLAPDLVSQPAPAGDGLVVATLNLRFGEAETGAVAAWLREHDADLVVLTEVTPEALAALEADPRVGPPGRGPWPHRAGRARPQAAGTVVLSRLRLGEQRPLRLGNSGWRMRVEHTVPLTLTAAHTAYPLQALEPWRGDLRRLADDASSVDGPHLVVGDLNATLDHRALREVLAARPDGLRDAAEQAGSGWQPTWPAPGESTALGARLPVALLALDHVLVSPGIVASRTTTQAVPGTDHLALVARLEVARTLVRR